MPQQSRPMAMKCANDPKPIGTIGAEGDLDRRGAGHLETWRRDLLKMHKANCLPFKQEQ